MPRNIAAFKLPAFMRMVRTALACSLCLLAFVFAVEAKTAWYGPTVGPGSDVRAAKALPVSVPRIVQHGSQTTAPVYPLISIVLLSAFLATSLAGSDLIAGRNLPLAPVRVSSAPYFSSQSFFRPPPSRS